MTAAFIGPASTLHLLGSFEQPYAGAALELLDIQRLMRGRREVLAWAEGSVHSQYKNSGIAAIRPFAQQFPKSGTLLILGVHVMPGVWLKYARFDRVIIFCNLIDHSLLFTAVQHLRQETGLEPELVFVSQALQTSVGLPGRVVPSVMELGPYLNVAAKRFSPEPVIEVARRHVTVGRMSRDIPGKHHPDDPALYRMLALHGVNVRIMGGTCLAGEIGVVKGIELVPAGQLPVTDFCASLDIFFYRTGTTNEAYGRVVLEAMATGLAVVGHVRGGYAEIIEPGVSGLLIRSQEEAYDAILSLVSSAGLRRELGQAAMKKAMQVHGPEGANREMISYLSSADLT